MGLFDQYIKRSADPITGESTVKRLVIFSKDKDGKPIDLQNMQRRRITEFCEANGITRKQFRKMLRAQRITDANAKKLERVTNNEE